jgi:hypothetical protein
MFYTTPPLMKALILAHLATVLSASSIAETLFTPAQNVPADGLPDRASAIAIKLWLVQCELGVMQMPTSPMPRISCMSCFSSCLVLGSNLELKLKMWGSFTAVSQCSKHCLKILSAHQPVLITKVEAFFFLLDLLNLAYSLYGLL